MSGAFAKGTTVQAEKSRMEIEQTLMRYGATGFAFASEGERHRVEFVAHARRVRFDVRLPALSSFTSWGRRSAKDRQADEVRRLWRALLLAIKAKLEVVESGMAIFEEEFMANIVMPDGRTVGQHAMPAITKAYESGRVVALLPEHTA